MTIAKKIRKTIRQNRAAQTDLVLIGLRWASDLSFTERVKVGFAIITGKWRTK